MSTLSLKVPKRENFSLVFFELSEPIWVCELGTAEKNRIFYRLTPGFDGFWYLPHTECAAKQKKIEARPKLKLVVVAFEPRSMPAMCFSENFEVLVIL